VTAERPERDDPPHDPATAAEAEERRRRDELLRALVHDLRNPLNGVLTWIHLLAGGRLDPDTARHALQSVERECEQQARLLADVADFAELAGEEECVRTEATDPRAVVLAAVDALRAQAELASVRLDVELGAAPTIRCDPAWIQRAVFSLVARAIEPTNEAASVTVTVRSDAAVLEIEVADDGRGFPTAERASLFEPLTREGRSIDGRMLRLHLAIADRVARRHDGRLEAESAGPGAGSKLRLRVPLGTGPVGPVGPESTVGQ
jgi:signal transduction histidine kinase